MNDAALPSPDHHRVSTGVPRLDKHLGGGLLPGTMTVVLGSTGIGKTQLGVHFSQQPAPLPGLIFDMSARGDGQNHAGYARRMYHQDLAETRRDKVFSAAEIFNNQLEPGNYLHVFEDRGQRVTKRDLDFDQWRDWQSQLNQKLQTSIGFFYSNLIRGCRRIVIDGIEPVGTSAESIQLNLLEYVYQQVLKKHPEWLARDLFRQEFSKVRSDVIAHLYQPQNVACQVLWTSREMMLDDLIARQIDEGDILSNANTIILMGKTREEGRMGRSLYIAKHRGSQCSDEVIPFRIDDSGIVLI